MGTVTDMGKRIEMKGKRFGRLLVVAEHPERNKRGLAMWEAVCDCGGKKIAIGSNLRRGITNSCGCLRREQLDEVHESLVKHGEARTGGMTPEYVAWRAMKRRCHPASRSFPDYGARGITVCERWANSYDAFLADMGRKPSPQHSLDRIDNDGNYEPGNCRWATIMEQRHNQRPPRKRGPLTDEHKAKLSKALTGRKMNFSEEAMANIRAAAAKRRGKPLTAEHRKKIGDASRRMWAKKKAMQQRKV